VPLSTEARPFYKSGGSYLQRHLPFWLWVFTSRLLLLLVPILGIAYPVSQIIPAVLDMIVNTRMNRLYAELRAIEGRMDENVARERVAADFERLRAKVLRARVPARNARTLYTLRHHMALVCERLEKHGIRLEDGS